LIQLVQDPDAEVARQAAPGLGKIGEPRARDPLIEAMKTADKDSRNKYLEALRDGIGTEGLVLSLGESGAVPPFFAAWLPALLFASIGGLWLIRLEGF